MFARYARAEVKTVIGITTLSGAAIIFASLWQGWLWGLLLLVGPVGLGVVGLQFFRDPERQIPDGDRKLLAPADGLVMEIEDGVEHPYLGRAKRLGIFMSLFNVHVNRIPIDGEVDHIARRNGLFLKANRPEAAGENTAVEMGLSTRWGRVLVRQVAGIVARRIVCDVHKGQKVIRGERFGMIKYGSRLEVWVEEKVPFKWCVEPGEKTVAGETVIGEFLDEA